MIYLGFVIPTVNHSLKFLSDAKKVVFKCDLKWSAADVHADREPIKVSVRATSINHM